MNINYYIYFKDKIPLDFEIFYYARARNWSFSLQVV